MTGEDERRVAFEARLQELKRKMEAGLAVRAKTLRDAVNRLLAGDESARRVLKQEGHKLRGIAGSYGHQQLTDLAGDLEQRASLSPPPVLERLALSLADAADDVSRRSESAQSERKDATSSSTTGGQPAAARAASVPAPASRKRGGSVRPKVKGSHGGALRVLAMDDDPTTLRLLRLTLKDIGGFEAEIVTSARAALDLMQAREFDVVISDAMMPDMNGQEFCAAARKLGGWAVGVPIVILSAATQEELGWKGSISTSVAWLRKPFMPSALVKDVAKIVETSRKK